MAQKTKIWYLQNFNLLMGMDADSMMMMDQKSKMKKVSKREIIYFHEERSDNIYLLKDGMSNCFFKAIYRNIRKKND